MGRQSAAGRPRCADQQFAALAGAVGALPGRRGHRRAWVRRPARSARFVRAAAIAAKRDLLCRAAGLQAIRRELRAAGPDRRGGPLRAGQSGHARPVHPRRAGAADISEKERAHRVRIRGARLVHPLPAAATAPHGHRRLRTRSGLRATEPVGAQRPCIVSATSSTNRRAAGEGKCFVRPPPRAQQECDRVSLRRHVVVLAAAHGQLRVCLADPLLS